MKESAIYLRISKKDKENIIKKSKKANMSITEYLVASANNCNINYIDKNGEFETELRRIGNNINQLTRLANSGIINCVDLAEVKGDLKKLWQLLNSLTTT